MGQDELCVTFLLTVALTCIMGRSGRWRAAAGPQLFAASLWS